MRKIILYLVFLLIPFAAMAQKESDAQKLGKALDYFSSQKYHEALLIFQKLDKEYQLNPRYMAFIGTCYYYEWDYPNAIKYLNGAIPELKNFAPHERSFYYWANGEGNFNEKQYKEAIPLYEEMLNLCYDNEKPDAYYRLGFCYMFINNWNQSYENFTKSLEYYEKYRNTDDEKARIRQIKNMLNGIEQKIKTN